MGGSEVQEGSKNKCALCEGRARMYCESDDAALCWDCDACVHGANFLVARHARALLCRTCGSATNWKASGARVTPTVSLCSQCCFGGDGVGNLGVIEGNSRPSEDDDEEEEKVGNGNEEEEDGDNQVVPWGMPVSVGTTPPEGSSSSSGGLTWKQARNNNQEEQSSSSRSKDHHEADQAASKTAVKLIEFDIIRGVAEDREKGVLKVGWNQRLRSKRKRSMAFAHHAAVSSSSGAGSRPLAAFPPAVVTGEPSMSTCHSARRAIPPPDFIQC